MSEQSRKPIATMLTMADVATRLNCDATHAARFLAKHNVPRTNIGIGKKEKYLRVDSADLEAAIVAARVSDAKPVERTRGYVPTYT